MDVFLNLGNSNHLFAKNCVRTDDLLFSVKSRMWWWLSLFFKKNQSISGQLLNNFTWIPALQYWKLCTKRVKVFKAGNCYANAFLSLLFYKWWWICIYANIWKSSLVQLLVNWMYRCKHFQCVNSNKTQCHKSANEIEPNKSSRI